MLRHKEGYIDLNGGWAEVSKVIHDIQKYDCTFTLDDLDEIVSTDEKCRYAYDTTGKRIRANQGHSIKGVVIEMESPEPPEILYHGTAEKSIPSIMEYGLYPMTRQFVHISPDVDTAYRVGRRHGKPVVLTIRAQDFVKDGFELKRSANGVWQARTVPPEYLAILSEV